MFYLLGLGRERLRIANTSVANRSQLNFEPRKDEDDKDK